MWFLIDIRSEEKVSQDFPSQAKLAQFMQMCPQTLHKAIKEGRNVFVFRKKGVKVVQEKIPHFAVFDFPSSEKPIETFEMVSELAKWLNVTRQAVYAAINRSGDEKKIKNKEGKFFFLKQLEAAPIQQKPAETLPKETILPAPPSSPILPAPPIPLPRKKKVPPVPFPRKKKEISPSPAFYEEEMTEEEEARITRAFLADLGKKQYLRDCRREENRKALRCKYWKWFLDPDVNIEMEETLMVIFNPDTGEDIIVKNYKDIADYFTCKNYKSFLQEDIFNANIHRGTLEFSALSENKSETWIRFIFIKDPVYA